MYSIHLLLTLKTVVCSCFLALDLYENIALHPQSYNPSCGLSNDGIHTQILYFSTRLTD